MIQRTIQSQIENCFFKGKAVIIYGARQVGKTTLIQEIQKKYPLASHSSYSWTIFETGKWWPPALHRLIGRMKSPRHVSGNCGKAR
jgi:hypothetical protein